jgi:exosortase
MILGLMLISAVVYWPSTTALYEAWTDFHGLGYTHGPLIVVVCVVLLYRRRWELESAPAQPWPLALAALAICSLAWLVCFRASIQDLHILLFPAAMALAVAAVWGPRVARIAALPVLFFYFASSAWGEFSPYLQALTVLVTRGLIALTGMNVTVTDNVIRMPFGTFVVESGCSGLHFLLVGLAVATLHGELRNDPVRLRIKHIVVMGVLALMSNWVRVYTVVRAGYETHMRHVLVSRGHYYFGWMVFVFALAIFFWLARRYSRSADAAAGVALSSPRSIAPQQIEGRPTRVHAAALSIGAATLSMIAAPTLSYAVKWVQGRPAVPRVEFAALEGWSGPGPIGASVWKPVFAGAAVLESRQYSDAGGTIEALGVAYSRQSQGSELIGETSSLTGSGGLEVESEQRIRGPAGQFVETVARAPDGRRSVLWSRYDIGGRPLTVPVLAQLWYGLGSLVSEPLTGLVALRTECVPDCAAARRRIENLALRMPVRLTGAAGEK